MADSTKTRTVGLASTNDPVTEGITAMAQSGEFFNQLIFNTLAKGFGDINKDLNKVKVVLELTPEQREELLDIALFMRRQQELESDAQLGLLNDEYLKNLKQLKLVMDKHCSLLEEIINLNKENSSQA